MAHNLIKLHQIEDAMRAMPKWHGIEFRIEPVYASRGFHTQRADYYDGNIHAFHEWTMFPHFGKVMAAAITGEKCETTTSYWLNGHGEDREAITELLAMLNLDPSKYEAEEEPYGPGFFPVCKEYDDAVAYYVAAKLHARREKGQK